eukprot:766947-Hanusia_phi.AAC.2
MQETQGFLPLHCVPVPEEREETGQDTGVRGPNDNLKGLFYFRHSYILCHSDSLVTVLAPSAGGGRPPPGRRTAAPESRRA